MPITFIPYDGWQPSASYFGEGWSQATDLYPAYNSARPWRPFLSTGGTVGVITGAHVHIWNSGLGSAAYAPDAQTVFCGTGSSALALPERLYTVDSAGAFTDISRPANYASFTAGWRFASAGNDIWAANGVDPIQRRTNNAGLFADGPTSTFVPRARFLVPVREHLVGAALSNAGRFQDEVIWSDSDDTTNYDPAATGSTSVSLAGSKRLVSIPGQITGLVGGQYLLVFKRTGIYYGEYAGPPTIFNFDVLSPNIGTPWPSSIINSRFGVFFIGADGVYKIDGLSYPSKISSPGIDRELMLGLTAYPSSTYAWKEDISAFGFQSFSMPLVGWAISKNPYSDVGAEFGLVLNPVTGAWSRVTFTDDGSSKPTAAVSRPAAPTIYDGLIGFNYDGVGGRFAPFANDAAATVRAPYLQSNFRPLNMDAQERDKRGNQMGQCQIYGALPIFSKTAPSANPMIESVTIETMLDSHGSITGNETRVSSERNPISGFYPFTAAGRFARVTIACAAEDFANFEGIQLHWESL